MTHSTHPTARAVALTFILCACSPGKESPWSGGGSSTPAPTNDTATAMESDTAGDTGSGGDGGSPTGPVTGVGEWADCVGFDAVESDHFEYNWYRENDAALAPPGTECRCSVEFAGIEVGELYDISVVGDARDLDGDGTKDAGSVPESIAMHTPAGDIKGWASTSWETGDPTWHNAHNTMTLKESDLNGTWYVFLPELNRDGGYISSCSDYRLPQVMVKHHDSSEGMRVPPFLDASGAPEDALLCSAGSTGSTSFQLVDLPTFVHPVPLAVGGDQHYAGTALTQVTVTAWNNADQLVLRHGPDSVTLTPDAPTATLPADTFYFGSNSWWPDRTAGDGLTWSNPQVQLSTSCPATAPAGMTRTPGYALTLSALDSAISSATGGVGLVDIVSSGSASTWPVYTVRVAPIIASFGSGVTDALRLEVAGTWGFAAVPMVATGTDTWSIDVIRPSYEAHGSASRTASGLTLALTSGSITTSTGTITLQPTTVTLPPVQTGQPAQP